MPQPNVLGQPLKSDDGCAAWSQKDKIELEKDENKGVSAHLGRGILREIEATPSRELLKHLPGSPGQVSGPTAIKKIGNPRKSEIPVFSGLLACWLAGLLAC